MSQNTKKVARGLKTAISNPTNSEEAKESAQQRLQELDQSSGLQGEDAHLDNAKIGHKAAVKNPNVSSEAKQRSKQALEDLGE